VVKKVQQNMRIHWTFLSFQTGSKIIDLVSVLQESLQQTEKGVKKKARPAGHHGKTALKKAA